MGTPIKRIVLTGFMGTGKTAVGRLVADSLAWPFIDSDHEIEAETGRTIPQIFEQDGEAAFRRLEKKSVKRLLKKEPAVIASGGGAILDPETRRLMKSASWLVCLVSSPETILKRLGDTQDRPLLRVEDPLAQIQRLIRERQPFYDEADDVIDTTDKSEKEIAAEIIRRLRTRNIG